MKNKIILIPIAIMLLSIAGIFLTIFFESRSFDLNNVPDFEFNGNFPSSSNDFSRANEMPYENAVDDTVSRPERKNNDISSMNPPDGNFNPEYDSKMPKRFENKKLSILGTIAVSVCTVLFTISLIYLIQSKLCKIKLSLEKDKLIIFILETIIISTALSIGLILITNNYILSYNNTSSSIVKTE